jgi:hypothetical protein
MIQRNHGTLALHGACTVEEAESLLGMVHEGAEAIDISLCTLLHTACLQVVLAAHLPVIGVPANDGLARWVAPGLQTQACTENV